MVFGAKWDENEHFGENSVWKPRNLAEFDRRLLWSSMPLLSVFYGSSTVLGIKWAGKEFFRG
jgi:hypothetical protein